MFHEVWKFKTAKVTTEVIPEHWQQYQSIGHVQFTTPLYQSAHI